MDETLCRYFNSKAGCPNGEKCQFKHTTLDPSAIELCSYFTGASKRCNKGETCMFRHESPGQPIWLDSETLQTDCSMHRHSSQANLAEEESSTSRNDSHDEDDFHHESFECEKHNNPLQGHEVILKDRTALRRYETEFPDLEAAAKGKGKKVENKQHAETSSLNENKTQTDCSMHRHSSQVNLAYEESSTSRNDSHGEDDFYQECFECEHCNFKIVITHTNEDEVALYEKHFREKHIDLLRGYEGILKHLTDLIRYEKEFPDLKTAAKVKEKKVKNKQHAKTSSLNENKTQNLVNVKYPGGNMNLEHHRFPECFPDERKELLNVVVSSYVSSFLSQEDQIACIMKEITLTEKDYCESLETVTKYLMNVGEDLQECATRLHEMFVFHMDLLRIGLNEASDLEIFVSKIFEKENYELYGEYILTLADYQKKLHDLRSGNIEFDEKCKEFESSERCLFRLKTLLVIPEKRFKYYVNICKRIVEICGQQECGKMNRKSNEIKLLGNTISGCIKNVMIGTDFELTYTDYRWKGRQLRMLRHTYYQAAIRAVIQKKTTSEAIQTAQLGRELGPKIKKANIWAAEQMLLSRCKLLQYQRQPQLDLHYLFQDEATDALKKVLSAIKKELHSKWSSQAVAFDLTIVTGKGSHSKNNQPTLITSVLTTLHREGYRWSVDQDGAYLIYFKIEKSNYMCT